MDAFVHFGFLFALWAGLIVALAPCLFRAISHQYAARYAGREARRAESASVRAEIAAYESSRRIHPMRHRRAA